MQRGGRRTDFPNRCVSKSVSQWDLLNDLREDLITKCACVREMWITGLPGTEQRTTAVALNACYSDFSSLLSLFPHVTWRGCIFSTAASTSCWKLQIAKITLECSLDLIFVVLATLWFRVMMILLRSQNMVTLVMGKETWASRFLANLQFSRVLHLENKGEW